MSDLMAPPPSRRSGTQVRERRDIPMTGLFAPGVQAPVPQADASEPGWPPQGAVTILPYLMLAFCFMLTAIFDSSEERTLLINVGLCALALAWMLWMFTLHPAWQQRPKIMAVFFTGLMVIMAVMVIRASWFGFFTLTGYFYALRLIRWPLRLWAVAAAGVMSGISQTYGVPKTNVIGLLVFFSVVGVNVLGACAFAYFLRISGEQAEKRKQAVEELSQANRKLEAALAENAGLHVQLLTQAREAGVLDERHRIAREIHDTLAQGLAGIITQLQAVEQADHDSPGWRRHVHAATALARESLSEARRSVHALRPESLETARLSEALADLAERWSTLYGIAIQVTTTGDVRPVLQDVELALLRTAQEALANVAKHARASRVGLTLSYMKDTVALDVRDDGTGFDLARLADATAGTDGADGAAAGGGFGLIAMRQRIEGLAGTLQIESETGEGTAISASIPVLPAPVIQAATIEVSA